MHFRLLRMMQYKDIAKRKHNHKHTLNVHFQHQQIERKRTAWRQSNQLQSESIGESYMWTDEKHDKLTEMNAGVVVSAGNMKEIWEDSPLRHGKHEGKVSNESTGKYLWKANKTK